jgi:ATP-binding cassette subfamily B protein
MPDPTLRPAPPEAGGWIARLWPFLAVHRRDVAVALGASILGQAVAALAPVIEKVIVDDVIASDRRPLGPWVALLVVAGLFGFGAAYVRRYTAGRVALDVQYDLRNAIFERLQYLDFASHDRLRTGQLVSRASSDVALIQGLLSFLPIVLGNLVLLVLALVVMVILSPPLTALVALTLPAMLVVALRLRSSIHPAAWDAQQRAAEVAGVVDEAVTGVRVVKGFGQEGRELRNLAATGGLLFRSRMRLIRLQAAFTPTLQAIPVLGQVAVLAAGGWLVIHGRISLGTLLAFSAYLVQLMAPVRMFAGMLAVGQQARAGGERLLDILDTEPMVEDRPGATDLVVTAGELHFSHVGFAYQGSSRPVLEDFELIVAPGEVVALVGASGSGKSTAALLLPRFYDVTSGAVTIDGTDVRDVTMASLRSQVGVVFEEPFLFSDSVRANIAYGRPGATDEEVCAAARAARADGFIRALPDGYDTVVGERGLTLSGGQRQRVALARALVSDPKVLLLDDATSSIDARTEGEIHDALRSSMVGRTTVLIAHRRSTLRLADRIVVVEGGRVADAGTHAELIGRSTAYRALVLGPDHSAPPAVVPAGGDGHGSRAGNGDGNGAGNGDRDGPATARVGGNGQGAPATITPAAWPEAARHRGHAATAAFDRAAPMGPGGGGAMMALAATPELAAALAKLPPADDDPEVDVEREAAAGESFRLRAFLRPYRAWLAIGFLLVAVDALLTLVGPLAVRTGVDEGVRAGDERMLWLSAGAFAVAALADWGVTRAYTLVTGRTAERLLYALRLRVFAHLQRLSLDYYDKELGGRVMTRMTTDVEALQNLLQTGLVSAIVSAATCVGVLAFLVALSPPLALAAGVVVPPLVLGTWWYRRRSGVLYAVARDRIATVNATFQESLSGVRVAQAYAREEREVDTFRAVNAGYRDARLGAQRMISIYFPFVLLLSELGTATVLAGGSVLVDRGQVTTGVVIAFVLYLDQFFAPIQQLSQVFDTWQQASASMDRVDELLATRTGTPPAASPLEPGRLTGALAFEGVHFRYPATVGDEALGGVDLRIAPGETVALVGETGAGKSTIVKLVARFYDPTAGRVTVDGLDLRDLDLPAYRRQLGVVPQEAFLFTGTLRDNIAYGRPDASDAEVEAAARAVGAHPFVAALPDGYLTAVSERGRSLSAGQRQLVALARARLVDPVVLLLDEATSNLDLATEAAVSRAMGAVAAGRTTLIVAHRLPTARAADRILVVDGGQVVAAGPHDELLHTSPTYAALWEAFAAEATAA